MEQESRSHSKPEEQRRRRPALPSEWRAYTKDVQAQREAREQQNRRTRRRLFYSALVVAGVLLLAAMKNIAAG